jgi:hypothetical protein
MIMRIVLRRLYCYSARLCDKHGLRSISSSNVTYPVRSAHEVRLGSQGILLRCKYVFTSHDKTTIFNQADALHQVSVVLHPELNGLVVTLLTNYHLVMSCRGHPFCAPFSR